ncbi:MAG: iron-sulfur cluster insertion protein ErpA [Gammaproteobacteria bacterium RIFCSPHIGHO2_12_FULL_37_34]|nr:MAG: iron-sulfur cluster insertion protein ErpA [Gammaproteobacteria bacterium RIFCSPHIGHO2_12_FULL_37_34]
MSQPLIFTEHAATKVWELMKEDGNLNLKLRVYVTGGGCSGFQYGFTFSEESQPDDIIISRLIKITDSQHEGDDEGDDEGDASGTTTVQLLVDSLSVQYLTGAEIDYKEDIEGEQFIIRNPNAKTTCGCGSSFTVE